MLLEDNGLLPFLEDWRFFAEPKIQSNTVVVVFLPNIIFYLYDIYTNNQSLYPLYMNLKVYILPPLNLENCSI